MRRSMSSSPGNQGFAFGRDAVDVVGAAQRGHADLALAGAFEQLEPSGSAHVAAVAVDGCVERLDPFAGLAGIDVGKLAG